MHQKHQPEADDGHMTEYPAKPVHTSISPRI
jgi:hypothetical protein